LLLDVVQKIRKGAKMTGYSLLPQYAEVLDYLHDHPGARAQMVADATGSSIHTTRSRLLRMQAEGVVRSERLPKALLFYVRESETS
jgi:hypothetical protein